MVMNYTRTFPLKMLEHLKIIFIIFKMFKLNISILNYNNNYYFHFYIIVALILICEIHFWGVVKGWYCLLERCLKETLFLITFLSNVKKGTNSEPQKQFLECCQMFWPISLRVLTIVATTKLIKSGFNRISWRDIADILAWYYVIKQLQRYHVEWKLR